MAAPEAAELNVGGRAAHIVSTGSASPASPPTAAAVTAASVVVLATTADAEGSEQGRVKIEPAGAQPRDGDVKKESTSPEDGGTGPRDNVGGGGGGGEVAKPAGTGSTGGNGNPDWAVGFSASVRSSPPSLSEWLKEVGANRSSPDGGVQYRKIKAIARRAGQVGPV